ncbi:MAG TPA: FAD:protein FMN transferase [Telluria sp.]|nr:FAD:protein FMN transferase [Telluria sp.]
MVTQPVYAVRFAAMASDCEVMLPAPDRAAAERLARCAIDEVRRIETKYSRYRPDSIVSRIGAAAGQDWVEIDVETAGLLGYADALFQSSEGLFDITSGVLRRAWNFRVARVPDDAELAPLLELIGWDKVERRPGAVRLPLAGMELDFGGFGKEYAADRAAAMLAAQGVRHGYVNLGGDLRALGPQPDGSPWQIGIQDPRNEANTIAGLPLANGALATSGDYERFMEVDGQRYCHILDPRTGWPRGHWRSVSVLAPLAVAAGSYTTIAMLQGERGLEFLDRCGLAYLAVDHTGRVFRRDAP